MKEVPIEKLIKETNGLIRAAAYKKRIEVQNKENYEAGLKLFRAWYLRPWQRIIRNCTVRSALTPNKKKAKEWRDRPWCVIQVKTGEESGIVWEAENQAILEPRFH